MRSNGIQPRALFTLRMLALLLSVAVAGPAIGRIDAAVPRRARPPKFGKSIQDAFFPDARAVLVGPRPAPAPPGNSPAATTPTDAPHPPSSPAGPGWSKWIAAEVVEDEIKSQQIMLAKIVQNPAQFKGGDYRKARAQLSVLAVMFGIVAEYDGPIRWKREAAAMRNALSRAGFNCKVGSDGSYKEAKTRVEDLQTLVRGGSLQLPDPAPDAPWPQVADRPPLMKRLEQAHDQGVAPLTADERQFERQADTLAHEAQIIAAIAEVISREGYEYADDETYLEYAKAMKMQALSLRDAAKAQNYEQARQAAGQLSKACSNCHDGYRS
jgi:cytochrome c556